MITSKKLSLKNDAWFALYVKARNEKKVANHLERIGVNVYCPTVVKMKQWSDRKKKLETPLISSYVFVQIEEKNRNKVFEVPGVVRYLFWQGKPAIVTDQEIKILKQWLQTEISETLIENLEKGDLFKVPNGPFQGKEGVVKEISKNRVQLMLLQLGIKITLTK